MNQKKEVQEAATTAAVVATESASWMQTRAILRIILLVLFVAAALWTLYALQTVILLVVLSIFFAYLISPLVEFVRRPLHIRGRERVMPRALAIGVVYLTLFGALGVGITFLYPSVRDQVEEFAKQVPTNYLPNARNSNAVQRLNKVYQQLPPKTREVIDSKVSETMASIGEGLLSLTTWLVYLPWLVLIPILAFFLLKDADGFRRTALQMLPRGRWRWRGDEFFQDVNSTLAAYIRAQLIACLLIGSVCTLGFILIGVPYALLLGIIAGLLEFIPLVGPLTVAVLAILITSFSSGQHTAIVLIFLGVLRILQDYVFYPRIIGQGIHLHPLAVILAILGGAELAGIAGIFLAIPVIAIATVTYRHWLEHRGSEGLVADILKPAEQVLAPEIPDTGNPTHALSDSADEDLHLTEDTTPEQMARIRPDLTTGELKLPDMD